MKWGSRLLLLILAAVIFICIAPLTVYYAMGYRFQVLTEDSSPIGVLIVETIPRRATVSLNSNEVGKSPLSVTNLKPGRTVVSVKRDGYVTWEKSVAISPSIVTELRDIRLFPENLFPNVIRKDISKFSLSPNRDLLAVISLLGKLSILDDDGVELLKSEQIVSFASDILWSPDSSYVLIKSNKQLWLFSVSGRQAKMEKLPLAGNKVLAWDQRIPGRMFLINEAGDLVARRIGNGQDEEIAAKVTNFAVSARRIFAVDNENKLSVFNLQGGLLDELDFTEYEPIKRVESTPAGQIAVEFADSSLAVVKDDKQIMPVAGRTLKYGWSPDGQMLYVQTDESSLHIFNVADERLRHVPLNQLRLVVRLSRPIRDAQWFAGGRHLIYQVDDEIVITEIDTRDYPVSFVVDRTDLGSSSATVGAKGDSVFYLKDNGNSVDLVKASLAVD